MATVFALSAMALLMVLLTERGPVLHANVPVPPNKRNAVAYMMPVLNAIHDGMQSLHQKALDGLRQPVGNRNVGAISKSVQQAVEAMQLLYTELDHLEYDGGCPQLKAIAPLLVIVNEESTKYQKNPMDWHGRRPNPQQVNESELAVAFNQASAQFSDCLAGMSRFTVGSSLETKTADIREALLLLMNLMQRQLEPGIDNNLPYVHFYIAKAARSLSSLAYDLHRNFEVEQSVYLVSAEGVKTKVANDFFGLPSDINAVLASAKNVLLLAHNDGFLLLQVAQLDLAATGKESLDKPPKQILDLIASLENAAERVRIISQNTYKTAFAQLKIKDLALPWQRTPDPFLPYENASLDLKVVEKDFNNLVALIRAINVRAGMNGQGIAGRRIDEVIKLQNKAIEHLIGSDADRGALSAVGYFKSGQEAFMTTKGIPLADFNAAEKTTEEAVSALFKAAAAVRSADRAARMTKDSLPIYACPPKTDVCVYGKAGDLKKNPAFAPRGPTDRIVSWVENPKIATHCAVSLCGAKTGYCLFKDQGKASCVDPMPRDECDVPYGDRYIHSKVVCLASLKQKRLPVGYCCWPDDDAASCKGDLTTKETCTAQRPGKRLFFFPADEGKSNGETEAIAACRIGYPQCDPSIVAIMGGVEIDPAPPPSAEEAKSVPNPALANPAVPARPPANRVVGNDGRNVVRSPGAPLPGTGWGPFYFPGEGGGGRGV
jgi:hypothetical protein